MGSGNYSQIIYGILSMKDAGLVTESETEDPVIVLLEDLGINYKTSYEGATDYLGISIVSTLNYYGPRLNVGSCKISDLSKHILSQLPVKLVTEAKKEWDKFRKAAAKKDINVPAGYLLWVDDYD